MEALKQSENVRNVDYQVKGTNPRRIIFGFYWHWLWWVTKPLRMLWNVIVWIFTYLWSLVVMGWDGMFAAARAEYAIIGVISGIATTVLALLFIYIGSLADVASLMYIGGALSIIPFAWGLGEISAAIQNKNMNGPKYDIKANAFTGNGIKVVKNIILYVLLIVALLVIQIGIDYSAKIPFAGPILLAILLVPNILSSGAIIISVVLLLFSVLLLPSHLLVYQQESENMNFRQLFYSQNMSALKVLGKNFKWLRAILFVPISAFFGFVLSIPLFLLTQGSVFMSSSVGANIFDKFEAVMYSFQGAQEIEFKIAGFFAVISVAIIVGSTICLLLCNMASGYHLLYKEDRSSKKAIDQNDI